MKKFLLLLGGIGLSVMIGLSIPLVFKNETEGIKMERSLSSEEAQEQFIEELESLHAEKLAQSSPKVESSETSETAQGATATTSEGTEDNPDQGDKVQTSTVPNANTDKPQHTDTQAPIQSERVVKDAWVQDQIDQNRDQINDSELYTGAAIYNQLDTAYLFGLSEGGLTEEEKQEVSHYLKANLSSGETDTAMSLYYEYVNLLN